MAKQLNFIDALPCLEQLARKMGKSKSEFYRLFKDYFGKSPNDFRQSIRLLKAKELVLKSSYILVSFKKNEPYIEKDTTRYSTILRSAEIREIRISKGDITMMDVSYPDKK